MSLPEVALALAAGIGVYVAASQTVVGLARRPRDRVALALAVAAVATSVACLVVLATFGLTDPADYAAVIRWIYFPCILTWYAATLWAVAFLLCWAPRRTLLGLTAALAAVLVLNLSLPYGLYFAYLQPLAQITTMGGTLAYLDAPPHVLILAFDAVTVALVVFLLYAPLRSYRRSRTAGERRRAAFAGGAMIVFSAAAVIDILTVHLIIEDPFLTVLAYMSLLLFVVIALQVQSVRTERALRVHREELEELVQERVGELAEANSRLAEEASRRQVSEEQFRLIAENASDVVFRADNEGVFRWVSPSVTELVGWPPEQLVGRPVLGFIHPEDAERFQAMRKAVSEGSSVAYEMRLRRPDGSYRWLSSNTRPLLDAAGAVVGRVGSWRDVQAEVEARTALAESEARFRVAFDAVNETIALFRPIMEEGRFVDAEILWANRVARQRWLRGREQDEVRGLRLFQDLPQVREVVFAHMRAAAEDGEASAFTLTTLTTSGEQLLVEAHIAPFAGGFSLTTHNLTAEHLLRLTAEQGQERIRAMMDSLFDAHELLNAVRDESGELAGFIHADANAAACLLRGIAFDDLVGSRLTESRSVCTLAELAHVLETGEPLVVDDRAHEGAGPDGEVRRFDVRVVRLGDGVVETLRDVTQRHEGELALRQRLAELDALQRMSQLLVQRFELTPALQSCCALLQTLFAACLVAIRLVDDAPSGRFKDAASVGAGCGSSEWADSVAHDVLALRHETEAVGADGEQVLAIPLLTQDEVLGVLCIERGAGAATFKSAEQAVAGTAADLVAAVVHHERLHELETRHAAEEERRRIARDLHDAVTQSIYSASLIAEGLPAIYAQKPEKALEEVLAIRRLIRAAFAELRILLFELRPETLALASLETLLQRLAEALSGEGEMAVELDVDRDVVLESEVRAVFYRVAQEALNNVAKHARATRVRIRVTHKEGVVQLTVQDDGRGFDPQLQMGGMGQSIMRERAAAIGATLTVASEPWAGTTVTLAWRLPFEPVPANGAASNTMAGRATIG